MSKHLDKLQLKLRQRREAYEHPKRPSSGGKASTHRPGSMNKRKQA